MKQALTYGKRGDLALALGLWVKLARAYDTVSHRATEDIRRYGLTASQFGVLEALGHLGTLTPGELSRKMLSSCGTITVVLDNLEKEGLVRRRGCETDRRVVYVSLTPKGEQRFKASFPRHASFIEELLSVLTPAEQKRLSALLKKLGRGLESPAPSDNQSSLPTKEKGETL